MEYTFQEIYYAGTVHTEWVKDLASDAEAESAGQIAANSPVMQADYIRVLSVDGELIWTSNALERLRDEES